jgi:(3S)-malyl-CoA thioesterase
MASLRKDISQTRGQTMAAIHPYRSVLYIPGSKERALDKARGLPADAIIFDLEDAVAPDAKAEARATLRAALDAGGYGRRARIVRINALSTEWGLEDARAFADAGADAILLPKVNAPSDIDTLTDIIGPDLAVWTMMETPLSIFNAREIAAHPRVAGLVAGTNDLAKDLRTRARADRLPLMLALQNIVLAARAARIVAVDGVYNRFKDEDGLRVECEQGRDLGFDGKTLIHPAQIDIANTAFAPTEAEIELAERQISAYEESRASGQGIAVVDGQIVENLHVVTAQRILAQARAIRDLAAE